MAADLPKKIDRYEVISELGAGGMGRVYKANDPRLDREVVIKVIADIYLNDPEFLKRFEHEAKIVAKLNHPNILQVFDVGLTRVQYDWGQSQQEIPYFVINYIQGDDLAKWIKQGKLTNNFEQIAQIVLEVASALDYAYDNYQLVHRDIKPANILLDNKHKNRVVLADFGIAKLLQSGNSLTGSGVIGTPEYISPERIKSKKGQILDSRSDQYSLAVVLYEMLTGAVPFQSDEAFGTALAHVTDNVPDARDYNTLITQPMIDVLNKALAKNPDDRYLTNTYFAKNFDLAVKAQPVLPPNISVAPSVVSNPHPFAMYVAPQSPIAKPVVPITNIKSEFTIKPEFTLFRTLKGHSGWVSGVAWSSGGQLLASASEDKTIKLWDVSGKLLSTLKGHSSMVSSVAWSLGVQLLASASDDTTIKLWNSSGKLVNTLQGHADSVYSVAWSPTWQMLASASDDTTVKLWNASGKLLNTLQGHSSTVSSVAWSPDGQLLASASWDTTIILWNASGKPLSILQGHTSRVNSVAWSPDGQLLASASRDGTIRLWHISGKLFNILQGQTSIANSIAWSPDGQLLAAALRSGRVNLWDVAGNLLITLQDHSSTVSSLAWLPNNGHLLASASHDHTIRLWKRV